MFRFQNIEADVELVSKRWKIAENSGFFRMLALDKRDFADYNKKKG